MQNKNIFTLNSTLSDNFGSIAATLTTLCFLSCFRRESDRGEADATVEGQCPHHLLGCVSVATQCCEVSRVAESVVSNKSLPSNVSITLYHTDPALFH